MPDIKEIRRDFPILSREVHGKPLVYLDSGATAQKPLAVIETVNRLHSELNANIHRGAHYLSEQTTARYEEARETVREFIGAGSTREIVFTSGATAAINLVAYSYGEKFVEPGDNIVVSEMEHHSNIVPWQLLCERKQAQLRVLPFDDSGRLKTEELDGLTDDRTRMVAVTEASNVLGTRPDIKKIVELCHGKNIPVLVDGCQGVVHGTENMTDLGCDFYVFSGHKLYGPTGIGVLYGKQEWLERMPPFMGGGDMVSTVSFNRTDYADLPLKFEAGTSNYIGAIGLAEAIRYVEGIGHDWIAGHERELLARATDSISGMAGVRIYGSQPDKCSIVSFTVEGTHPYDVGMILDKQGVAIRTGTHCAEPVMTHYGITGMCRVSLALYNTLEEIDIFRDSLEKAVRMLKL